MVDIGCSRSYLTWLRHCAQLQLSSDVRLMSVSPKHPHGQQPIVRDGAPLDKARRVVILLHGRGASAESMLTIAQKLRLDDTAFLAPQAYGHTWYPQSFLVPLSQNEPALSSALRKVGEVVSIAEDAGHPPENVAILGFSQGACLASEFVARNPQRYGGLIAFSGGLIGSHDSPQSADGGKLFDYDGSLDGTPVFLGCSDVDPHIPVERVQKTGDVLKKLGADVQVEIYEGMGHTIVQDELDQAERLLQKLPV